MLRPPCVAPSGRTAPRRRRCIQSRSPSSRRCPFGAVHGHQPCRSATDPQPVDHDLLPARRQDHPPLGPGLGVAGVRQDARQAVQEAAEECAEVRQHRARLREACVGRRVLVGCAERIVEEGRVALLEELGRTLAATGPGRVDPEQRREHRRSHVAGSLVTQGESQRCRFDLGTIPVADREERRGGLGRLGQRLVQPVPVVVDDGAGPGIAGHHDGLGRRLPLVGWLVSQRTDDLGRATQEGDRGQVDEGAVVDRLERLRRSANTTDLETAAVASTRDSSHSATPAITGSASNRVNSRSPVTLAYSSKARPTSSVT